MSKSPKTDEFVDACRALSFSDETIQWMIQCAAALRIELDDPVASFLLIAGLIQEGQLAHGEFAKSLPASFDLMARDLTAKIISSSQDAAAAASRTGSEVVAKEVLDELRQYRAWSSRRHFAVVAFALLVASLGSFAAGNLLGSVPTISLEKLVFGYGGGDRALVVHELLEQMRAENWLDQVNRVWLRIAPFVYICIGSAGVVAVQACVEFIRMVRKR